MLDDVLKAFDLTAETNTVTAFGSGLINRTWKVFAAGRAYILQRINHDVFKSPQAIVHNINVTGSYLYKHYPDYLFIRPVKSVYNEEIFYDGKTGGYFRLYPFVENSHTIDVVQKPQQAYEAARQFGKFTQLLRGFDVQQLKITLPDFHNLSLRYRQFKTALEKGNATRIRNSDALIEQAESYKQIVHSFEELNTNPQFKLRATHHDTKISNVLFDDSDKGLCVIDLDTLMPGYFISDVGDMLRTYLSPVSEEEPDFSKIEIREEYFLAILQAYFGELGNELSDEEKKHFVYAGRFMIYMQALRFLTDYLNDDVYYGSKYEGQNFVRAGNQLTLLEKLTDKEEKLYEFVASFSTLQATAH